MNKQEDVVSGLKEKINEASVHIKRRNVEMKVKMWTQSLCRKRHCGIVLDRIQTHLYRQDRDDAGLR